MRKNPRGYVIQLYQFAIRYAYNNRQFLSYFNNNIVEESHVEGQSADFLTRDPSLVPFLYRIVIRKDGCKEIYDALKAMGFTRRFVYPELEQVKYRFEHV